MENERPSLRSIGIKYGLLATAGMIVYFIIMRMLNLIHIAEFRYINYIIIAIAVYLAFKEEQRKMHEKSINYLPGLGLGAWVAASAALFFSLFVFIYAKIDASFVETASKNIPILNTEMVNAYFVAMMVFSEMFVFGIIISFVLMQLFKRNRIGEGEAHKFDS